MQNRRTEPRLLCADLVDIRWTDAKGRAHQVVANLEDISRSGACLQVETAVPVGAEVRISYSEGEFQGTVCHSASRYGSHFVGIEFEPDFRWSASEFRPMHLLDPRQLMEQALARAGENRATGILQ